MPPCFIRAGIGRPCQGFGRVAESRSIKKLLEFPTFWQRPCFFSKESGRAKGTLGLEIHRSAVGFPHPLPLRSRVDPLGKKQERRIVSGESANILANPKIHQLMVAQSPGALVSARRGLRGGAGSLLERWRKQMSLKWSLDRHADKC